MTDYIISQYKPFAFTIYPIDYTKSNIYKLSSKLKTHEQVKEIKAF